MSEIKRTPTEYYLVKISKLIPSNEKCIFKYRNANARTQHCNAERGLGLEYKIEQN